MIKITSASGLQPTFSDGRMLSHLGQPHTLFLLIALLFGCIFTFITPPMRVGDEQAHFTRVLGLAHGELLNSPPLPTYLQNFILRQYRIAISLESERTLATVTEQLAMTPKDPNRMVDSAALFKRAVIYTPAPYLTALPLTWLAVQMDASPLLTLYLTRLGLSLGGILLIYFAIRLTPILKWQMLLLASFPTILFFRSGASVDPLTNGYAFLLTALLLHLLLYEQSITSRHIGWLSLLSLLLCLSKNTYFLIAWMILLLPRRRFGSMRQYGIALIGVIVLPLVLNMLWLYLIRHGNFYRPVGVNEMQQMQFFLGHPLTFLEAMATTIRDKWVGWLVQMTGVLALNDIRLPRTWGLLVFLCLFLIPSAAHGAPSVPARFRLLAAGIFIASTVMIFVAMYATWTPVGADYVKGIQGRYFIPILPMLLLATAWRGPPKYIRILTRVAVVLIVVLLTIGVRRLLLKDYYF